MNYQLQRTVLLIALAAATVAAQGKTMYVIKSGSVIFKKAVSEIDSIIFYDPAPATPPVVDVDGNSYTTVTIGAQVWMAENLKTTRYADGTPVPAITSVAAWDALAKSSKGYSWYNDSISYKDAYGALYTWPAAVNGAQGSAAIPSGVQGACPTGWHIPSTGEWESLITYLGGRRDKVGGKLKERDTLHWKSPNTDATNETDFTARPGGMRFVDGASVRLGEDAIMWSATFDSINTTAGYVNLYEESASIYVGRATTEIGYSVRCVKN